MENFISYLRVSSKLQGSDGLGIAAQRAAIGSYVEKNGGVIIQEFVEVISGKSEKEELGKAVKICKKMNATLLVLRVDRLSRKAVEVLQLIGQVKFQIVEQPNLNALSIGIMALLAQEEARLIGERTRQALQAAKSRGVILGKNGKNFGKIMKAKSDAFAELHREKLSELYGKGLSANRISQIFNTEGVKSANGGTWQATQVLAMARRLALIG